MASPIAPRLYSPDPPPLRTRMQDQPTLLVSWWCTGFAMTIIAFRLTGRIIRTERLFREDKIMALALIPLAARMGLVHVVLIWGTNNTDIAGLDPAAISRREVGSGLVLASRIMYAAVLWIEKFTITEFFKRITSSFWKRSYEVGILALRWFLLATFLAIVVSTLAECRPFAHYWQVAPDPGPQCRQGYVQLLTMGTANVMTDLLLMCFPIPIILRSSMRAMRKFELILLFALSIIPIAITLYRLPNIISHQGRQQSRTLWASAEILASTAVTNALVLGSFVRDRGPKKMRFRFGSASDSLSRPSTRRDLGKTDVFWGSDEDLVRGLGLNLSPELRGDEAFRPRPAPVAIPGRAAASPVTPPPHFATTAWHFPTDDKSDPELALTVPEADRSPGEVAILTPRKVSFFDVGGLLEDSTPRPSASTATTAERKLSAQSHDLASSRRGSSRQGTHALLHDVGGLLAAEEIRNGAISPRTQSTSSEPRGRPPPQSDAQAIISALQVPPLARQPPPAARGRIQSLQDVGGLLSPDERLEHDGHGSASSRRPPPPPRSGPSLQDVGGLLAADAAAAARQDPPPRQDSPHLTSSPSRPSTHGQGLQDVGGLLAAEAADDLRPRSTSIRGRAPRGPSPTNVRQGHSPQPINFSHPGVPPEARPYRAPW
ncbi:MAG: hypothetical protein M1832_001034 [Thelocarpon impressellum]|nr:MAG: hypothetical protein M1832_001034 [Thelocarpon impressellum]